MYYNHLSWKWSDSISTSNLLLSSFLAVSLGVSLEGDLGPPWVWAGAGYLFIWPHCGCLGGARYGRECGLLLQEGLGLAAVFKPLLTWWMQDVGGASVSEKWGHMSSHWFETANSLKLCSAYMRQSAHACTQIHSNNEVSCAANVSYLTGYKLYSK